ncbi:unnamed protein product [Linum trigynum]|uniref:Uncharacterized protein n=1 Tax=Linum trigynum TaxID=586398 RepID=A0AAV2EEI4_9ROSI
MNNESVLLQQYIKPSLTPSHSHLLTATTGSRSAPPPPPPIIIEFPPFSYVAFARQRLIVTITGGGRNQ